MHSCLGLNCTSGGWKPSKRCVILFIFEVIQKHRSGFLLSHWINSEVWHLGDPVNTTYHNYFTTLMMSPRGRALCSCTTLKRRTLPITRTESDWRVNKILQSMSVTSDAATCCLSDKSFDTVTRQDLQYRDIPAINHMFQWQRSPATKIENHRRLCFQHFSFKKVWKSSDSICVILSYAFYLDEERDADDSLKLLLNCNCIINFSIQAAKGERRHITKNLHVLLHVIVSDSDIYNPTSLININKSCWLFLLPNFHLSYIYSQLQLWIRFLCFWIVMFSIMRHFK